MRTLSLLALCLVWTGAHAQHTEVIELELDAAGLDRLAVDTGAGPLSVEGVADGERISVRADIDFPDADADEAAKILAERLTLTLEPGLRGAELVAELESSGWGLRWGGQPVMTLRVRVPERFALEVEDGSGSLEIRGVRGNIDIDDGSGSIVLTDVGGHVGIDDGSGSIALQNAGGDVVIEDGSGSLSVRRVAGSVTVDDGSGSMTISDVEGDLRVLDDGSGSLRTDDIRGNIELPD